MTKTPIEDFVKTLVPQPFDKSKVSERKGAIQDVLKKNTPVVSMFESGSWSHGTSVAGHSDVDYMAAALYDARPQRPSSALAALKKSLTGAHYAIWRLRQSSPTVKVDFFTDPNFEVVPAYYVGDRKGAMIFQIPGPADEWVDSAPLAHNEFVTKVNQDLKGKVKPLIRLVKAWKYHADVPVSSFYLEMRTAAYASSQDYIAYGVDLRFLFGRMISQELRAMNDPTNLVARINSTSSDERRREALRLLEEAKSNLDEAKRAQDDGERAAYHARMTRVFGYNFPYPTW